MKSIISAVILSLMLVAIFSIAITFFAQVALGVICAGLIVIVFSTAINLEYDKEK